MDDFGKMFPLDEEYADIFVDGAGLTDEQKTALGEQGKAAIQAALKSLGKWKAEMSPEVQKAIGVLGRATNYGEGFGAPAKAAAAKCPECGAELPPGATVCPKCKAKIEAALPPGEPAKKTAGLVCARAAKALRRLADAMDAIQKKAKAGKSEDFKIENMTDLDAFDVEVDLGEFATKEDGRPVVKASEFVEAIAKDVLPAVIQEGAK